MDGKIAFVDEDKGQTTFSITSVVIIFLKTLKPSRGRRSWTNFKENSLNL